MSSEPVFYGERPSPMARITDECRTEVLCRWVQGAVEAAADAAVVIGDGAAAAQVRHLRQSRPHLALLIPAHDALARRFAAEVTDGRQHDLFAGDTDTRLADRWCRFAARYPFEPGRALVVRWILMAAHGWGDTAHAVGGLSSVKAANLLVGHVLTAPVTP